MSKMSVIEALALVIELAEQNVIEDDDMQDEADRQNEAIEVATEFVEHLKENRGW